MNYRTDEALVSQQTTGMRRYVVLLASILLQLCLGGVYAWSAFAPALRSSYGWSSAQAATVFGVAVASFTLSTIPAGRLLGRLGPRCITFAGSLLLCAGYLSASFSSGRFPGVLGGIGLCAGIGIGLCYVCPLAVCVAWFPKRKGTITGLAVAGFGAGALLLSAAVETLLARSLDLLTIFRLVGVSLACLALPCSLLLAFPRSHTSSRAQAPGLLALLRQKHFLSLGIGMFSGTFCGLLIVGNIKLLGLTNGLSAAQAAATVGIFAVGNAIGRVLWGVIYDRTGRLAIPASLLLLAAAAVLLAFAKGHTTFYACTLLCGFAFGGCFVLYATDLIAARGESSLGTIYPWIFQAYGLSGILGPALGGWAFDTFSSFIPGILTAVAVALTGALSTWWLGCRASVDKAPASSTHSARRRTSLGYSPRRLWQNLRQDQP